ncbi:MAG TPA: metal ABC transporter substrate-binding protein [Candidatus Binatia bacterium]|jgi:ABC-type Zn uptake system ZnuABC Zn-binding protein ZnuA
MKARDRSAGSANGGKPLAACIAALFVVAAIVLAPRLAPADSAAAAGERRLRIVASIPPLAMLVSELAGDRAVVRSILPGGADPHTFEPTPSDAKAVADADIVVSLGSSIDDWLGASIQASPSATVVKLDATPDGDDARDPHVWLDPLWVREHAIAPLQRALAAADPDGAARFGASARAMTEHLTDLDVQITRFFSHAITRSFVAWHPAWSIFARRYGLSAIDKIGEGEGREPSLRAMIATVRAARAVGVRAVLVEPRADSRLASVLADEIGVPMVTVDPIGDTSSVDRATYSNLMLYNVRAFGRALGVHNDAASKGSDAGDGARDDPAGGSRNAATQAAGVAAPISERPPVLP